MLQRQNEMITSETVSQPASFSDATHPLIIGRDADKKVLVQWLRNAHPDHTSMLLVEGEAGIGKTALINHILRENSETFHFKLYGKCHQSPSKTPYHALRQCMQHWLDQLLLLEDEAFETLKIRIRQALSPHKHTLTAVLEELSMILSSRHAHVQAEYASDPLQDRQRFHFYVHKLFKAIGETGYNTLLFLDDLQWADMAAIKLLEDLLTKYETPNLKIIGSFRPIQDVKRQVIWQKLRACSQVNYHCLAALPLQTLAKMIPPEWSLSSAERSAFSEYLMQESAGNPFNAWQLLSVIQHEHSFEQTASGLNFHWHHLPRLRQKASLQLITREWQGLSEASLSLLHTAACLGYFFSCEILEEVADIPQSLFRQAMQELVNRKLFVIQQSVCYFVHDNFYTAALSLLSSTEAQRLHARIATYFITHQALETRHTDFTACVNHLNLAHPGFPVLTDFTVAVLNLEAAKLAKSKGAFEKSLEHCRICSQLLSETDKNNGQPVEQTDDQSYIPEWLQAYDQPQVLLESKLQYAESLFLVHQFEEAFQLLESFFSSTQDRFMLLRSYTIKMKICIACVNLKDAPAILKDGMGITEAVLQQYQIHLPQTEQEYQTRSYEIYQQIKAMIQQNGMDWVIRRTWSEDKEFHHLMYFVVHALPLIFFVDVQKSKFLALNAMYQCLVRGFTPGTPVLFASSIWTTTFFHKEYELGLALGNVALEMIKHEQYDGVKHAVIHLSTLNFYNWTHHYQKASQLLDEGTQLAMEHGDHNYAVFCATNARLIDLFRGVNLKKHIYSTLHKKSGYLHVHFVSRSHTTFIKLMSGRKEGFLEGTFRFSKLLRHEATYNINCQYHLNHVLEKLYFFRGDHEKAYEAGDVCERHQTLYEAFPIGMEHDVFYSLNLYQLAQKYPERQQEYLHEISHKLHELSFLVTLGSGNFTHKKYLIEASLAAIHNQMPEAIEFYDKAIEEALKQEYTHIAAIAAELAGQYLDSIGRKRLAIPYLQEACRHYTSWGADAKVNWLIQKYPGIFEEQMPEKPSGMKTDIPYTLLLQSANLAQEIYLCDLIKKLLTITSQETGAEKASFIRKANLYWQVVGRLETASETSEFTMVNQKLEANDTEGAYITACGKFSEIVYVPDTAEMPDHFQQSHCKSHRVRSFLLVPVQRHEEILGLIYLENMATLQIEKRNLLGWLDILRQHAGIAISNAQLLENQQKMNTELKLLEQKRLETIVETQEKERKRIAADLHDHLGQMLALVRLNFSRLEEDIRSQLFEETCQLLDESCSEVRRIAHDIMPPDFEKKALTDILEALVRKYALAARLAYTFFHDHIPFELSSMIKLNLYRLLQEMITNVVRHAQATHIHVELLLEHECLHLITEDNGKGFTPQFSSEGLGLRNLYTRINLLKGRLDIDSGINRGTVFHIYIPIP